MITKIIFDYKRFLSLIFQILVFYVKIAKLSFIYIYIYVCLSVIYIRKKWPYYIALWYSTWDISFLFWLFWPLALYYLVMNQTTTIQSLWANNFLVLRLRFCDQWCQRLSQSWGKHYKQGWTKKWSLVSGNQCGENFLYHSPTRIVECRHSTRNFSGQGRFCEIRTLQ